MEHKLRESIESNNLVDVVNLLAQNVISQESIGEALKLAALKGKDDLVAALYKHVEDEEVRTCAILSAIASDHITIVKILIELGTDINARCKECSPLFLAVERENIQMIRLLIAHGADVDSRNLKVSWTPLMWATYQGKAVVADILVESGANMFANSIDSHPDLSSTLSLSNQFSDRLAEVNTLLAKLQNKLK